MIVIEPSGCNLYRNKIHYEVRKNYGSCKDCKYNNKNIRILIGISMNNLSKRLLNKYNNVYFFKYKSKFLEIPSNLI